MLERDREGIDYVLHSVRENYVKFIRLWFTDILRSLKGVAVTVEELESELVRNALGEHVFQSFIRNKKIEWDRYSSQVTDYEIKNYLPTL